MFGYLRETLPKVIDREDKPLISIEPKVDFTILPNRTNLKKNIRTLLTFQETFFE